MTAKAPTTIGSLRHRITFQSLSTVADGQGGSTESWTNFKTVWAELKPTSGRERMFAQRIEDVYSHKITIRKTDGITTTMRISFQNRIFQIKSIQKDIEEPFWMHLLTEEKVGT